MVSKLGSPALVLHLKDLPGVAPAGSLTGPSRWFVGFALFCFGWLWFEGGAGGVVLQILFSLCDQPFHFRPALGIGIKVDYFKGSGSPKRLRAMLPGKCGGAECRP